ncbi:helix-turn-helix DNA binding domain protein [Mycobacterium phage Trooper]|nr:helix-turn-helix DNA binding domain protein [Mycobacterium phage Trooper]
MNYVTKKQLRAANFDLAVELGDTKAELADVKALRDVLTSENNRLTVANVKLSAVANSAIRSNHDLKQQLNTAKRAFGEAFVKGEPEPPRGPSRPNRKKLSEADAKDIRNAYYGGAKQKDLARNYGVNPATISRLVRGIYH